MKRAGKRKLPVLCVAMLLAVSVVQAPVFAGEFPDSAAVAGPEPIVITPEQVEQALAHGAPGEEKTVRLAVRADADAEHLLVRLNAAQILAIYDDHPRNLVVLETPLGVFASFLNGDAFRQLAEELDVAVENIWVEAAVRTTGPDEREQIRRAAEEQGMTLLAEPVAVKIEAWVNGEFFTNEGFDAFFTQWLPSETALDRVFSTAMGFNPKNGRFWAKTTVSSVHGDRQMVTMTVCGCVHYYFVVTNVKTFSDVLDAPYREAVHRMAAHGIIKGTGDGAFRPDRLLTRAELAAMAARFYAMEEEGDAELAAEAFDDVDADDWFAGYAGALYRTGILEGGRFNPNGHVTADEIYAAFLSNEIVQSMFPFVGERIPAGGPYATRAEAVTIFDQMLKAYELFTERVQQRILQGWDHERSESRTNE